MNATFQSSEAIRSTSGLSNLRVVHVVRQYVPNIGGLEDVVRNLVAEQKGRFAGLKVVTLDRLFNDPAVVLPKTEIVDGVEVLRIPFRGSSRYPIAPAVFSRISDADIVHVHAIDFFFDALALSRFWHGKKLVATTHGGFFHTQKFAQVKAVWFNTLTRFSAHQYDAIACCSASDLEMFNRIAPKKTHLIENGVGINKFSGAASKQPEKSLLTLGRFSSNKRLDRLIDLMADLVAEDVNWKLNIAGMESDLTKADLLQQVEARGLSDNVEIHVGLSDQELKALIGRCSLFASASEYEGFGLALIEALSAGLMPVVHTNEAFVSLANGIPLVRTTDFSDRAGTIVAINATYNRLETDPSMREKAIDAVRSFGWTAKARQYDDLYLKALSG